MATVVLLSVHRFLGEGDAALLYMPVIVVIAAIGGVRAGLVSSVLGFFAGWYFFISGVYAWQVHDSGDWVSLSVFVLVGLGMGVQTTRMLSREDDLRLRESELMLLNRLGADLMQVDTLEACCRLVAAEIAALPHVAGVQLFLEDQGVMRLYHQEGAEAGGIDVAHLLCGAQVSAPGIIWLPLEAREVRGALRVMFVAPLTPAPREGRLYESLAQLTTAHLERHKLQAAASHAAAVIEADHLKTTFVTSVSHELKTPLTNVTATVTNLLETDIDPSRSDIRDELRRAASDLRRLNDSITGLLDLARLESNAWKPHMDWCSVEEILSAMRDRLPREKRGRLHVEVADGVPLILADEVQCARMFGLIVENALRYAPTPSPVTVRAEAEPSSIPGDPPAYVRIEVDDEGNGIAAGELERIFEKFYRGRAASSICAGTGLGLALSRDLVAVHGGEIWAENRSPKGARFVVRLPREARWKGRSDA